MTERMLLASSSVDFDWDGPVEERASMKGVRWCGGAEAKRVESVSKRPKKEDCMRYSKFQ